MSFSIDKTKIEELLADSNPRYVVTSTLMDAQPNRVTQQVSASVYGTISSPSIEGSEDDWPYALTPSAPASGRILKSLISHRRHEK